MPCGSRRFMPNRGEISIKGELVLLTTLNLSPRELLFIAALLDATEFMGVSDAFFGMEDDEIQQEMMLLQTSLEKKGYA